MSRSKVVSVDEALSHVTDGCRLMVGEFVGASQPLFCLEHLVKKGVRELTLIINTVGTGGGLGVAQLFRNHQVRELIATHVGTSKEATEEYLADRMIVKQFYPMGNWAEKVRAGAMGLGGILTPVGVGILDQPGLFPHMDGPKQKLTLRGKEYFVEEALRADVSIVRGWRADEMGNVELHNTGTQNQCDLAMAGDYAIAEVNEIVPVGAIPPDRVGIPGPFIKAVVKGYDLDEYNAIYRDNWIRLGKLAPMETEGAVS